MTINQNYFAAGEAFSRRQMLEMGMPIGNPHKPPFKQKEMPFIVSAVAAAGTAITAAGTAIAAGGVMASMGAIGTAALATVSAIGTVAAVAGTAMSVVGMVTGDKGLMKIGAIVGLAGGVASLASGAVASLAAGGEFAMGTAGIQSANAANAAAATAQTGLQSTALLGQATNAITPNFASGAVQAGSTQGLNSASIVGNSGNFVGGANVGAIGNVGGQVGSGLLQPAFSGAGAQALGATSTIGNVTGQVGSLATSGSSGFLNKLMADMTPKDYLLMGGSVVSGAMNEMDKNTASANAQKKYEYEQSVKNQRIANLNATPTLQTSRDPIAQQRRNLLSGGIA